MKRVLIVVDYQNDFVDGVLGFNGAKDLETGIADLMKEYAEDPEGMVICTFDTHEADYLNTQEGRRLPVEHCIDGTDGWQLYGKVADMEIQYPLKCTRVKKETFGSDALLHKLQKFNMDNNFGIESITLVGVVTNMCVISNAVIAKTACPEARIIIKKALTASNIEKLHQEALDVMQSMQMDIE